MTAAAIRLEDTETFSEIIQDPWLVSALVLGTVMTAGLAFAHACCFGAEAAMLRSLSIICTSTV